MYEITKKVEFERIVFRAARQGSPVPLRGESGARSGLGMTRSGSDRGGRDEAKAGPGRPRS